MKFKINFSKKTIESLGRKCVTFWLGNQTIIFSLILIIAIAIGGYVWYRSMYKSAWGEQRKEEFLREQDTGVKLKEKELERVIEGVNKRREAYGNQFESGKDIFAQ